MSFDCRWYFCPACRRGHADLTAEPPRCRCGETMVAGTPPEIRHEPPPPFADPFARRGLGEIAFAVGREFGRSLARRTATPTKTMPDEPLPTPASWWDRYDRGGGCHARDIENRALRDLAPGGAELLDALAGLHRAAEAFAAWPDCPEGALARLEKAKKSALGVRNRAVEALKSAAAP